MISGIRSFWQGQL